jgi:hypothetical protein
MAELQSWELEKDEEEERSFKETRCQSKDKNVAIYTVVSKLCTLALLCTLYLVACFSA